MPTLPAPYLNFAGGLNTKYNPYDLPDNQSPDLLNVQGTPSGSIATRSGVSTLASVGSGTPTGLFALETSSASVLVAVVGGVAYSITSGGTITALTGGTGMGTARWRFALAGMGTSGVRPAFGVNGTQSPRWFDITNASGTWTNATGGVSVPNGRYILSHDNQVFIAGTASLPTGITGLADPGSVLYWSAIGDPTNWDPASLTGAGYMEFDPGDGQAISGIGIVGPYILVAKPRKLWVLVDVATATARMLSDSIGASDGDTMASSPEGTFFMSEDRGVFLTNGSSLTPISDQILPSLHFLTGPAAYFQQHYYVVSSPFLYDFDTVLKSWWRHQLPGAAVPKSLVQWHPTADDPRLYAISSISAQGVVQRLASPGVSSDAGGNLSWHWFSPWQSPSFFRRRLFHTGYYRKRLRQVRVNGYGTVALSVAYNNVNNVRAISADAFAGANQLPIWTRFNSLGVANDFQLQFSGSDNLPASMAGYALMITDRKDSMT